ncbi:MAG TPA: hypothetical protein VE959_03495 [Bryobacteraceae bacterium]|nr:hypothetical protein [Bryobacteraceae bacterium]
MISRVWLAIPLLAPFCHGSVTGSLPVRVTWGYTRPASSSYSVQVTADRGMSIGAITGYRPESGGVHGVQFVLDCPPREEPRLQKLQVIWADLLAAADADTARRLGHDAAMDPHAPRLYIRTSEDGASGFAVTVEQLARERAMWVPSYDIYIAAGEPFVGFADHMASLEPWRGQTILERIGKEPEASYEQYAARWEDMGSPLYANPQQTGPGHIIGLAWDSSIPKFGIDRGSGVRNDLGNPDHFRFWFEFGDIAKGIAQTWKSQGLLDGLPVVTTVFERDQVRYEVEQFAYPLDGPPKERRGDIRMVLMQRLRLSSLDGQARRVPVTLSHRRAMNAGLSTVFEVEQNGPALTARSSSFGQTLLAVDGADGEAVWSGVHDYDNAGMRRLDITVPMDVPAQGARDLVVKLPSPMLDADGAATLAHIDYGAARNAALRFWAGWLEKGAQFNVPEKVVNDLFRTSLWHALRLPRRHDGAGEVPIDLPYSNFAYGQTGTPWPVNQAVYVDYMLFALRGYSDVANEELRAQYRNNQETSGHVSGYANWLVYTPGMLYATAQSYFLSGGRAALDRLMPESLKALDWCLDQIRVAERREGPTRGLVAGPLNDLTGDGIWAFNQAYLYAGLDLFGRALEQIGNPRGAEARAAAARLAAAIGRGFRVAAANSPLVQLRDHTWIPYVPCEANTFQRTLDDWYPADVDTGPVHLLRLKAVPAGSELAGWLLNDHEDNLFYKGWGIANEPVYNQHATAYLLRDDPEAVIRTFYSYMASAFSHSALEPVEHRFTHGQYFGPPSTDGAWFELYRNMLVMERDDDSLLLGGFTPRRWLEDGKRIEVLRAPTRFGLLSMTVRSRAAANAIEAEIQMPDRTPPSSLLIRLRHPAGAPIRGVQVNGRPWTSFDVSKEWVRVDAPAEKRYIIVTRY